MLNGQQFRAQVLPEPLSSASDRRRVCVRVERIEDDVAVRGRVLHHVPRDAGLEHYARVALHLARRLMEPAVHH